MTMPRAVPAAGREGTGVRGQGLDWREQIPLHGTGRGWGAATGSRDPGHPKSVLGDPGSSRLRGCLQAPAPRNCWPARSASLASLSPTLSGIKPPHHQSRLPQQGRIRPPCAGHRSCLSIQAVCPACRQPGPELRAWETQHASLPGSAGIRATILGVCRPAVATVGNDSPRHPRQGSPSTPRPHGLTFHAVGGEEADVAGLQRVLVGELRGAGLWL